MSIVLLGSTSGSCTLQEQAVAGTTVLTLPTTSGTVLTSASSITRSQLPTGSVLQVVSTLKTDTFSTSSGTYVAITGLSATITPSSSSNRILVQFSVNYGGDLEVWPGYKVSRDGGSTFLAVGDAAGSRDRITFGDGFTAGANANYEMRIGAFTFLDSPATTSALTYQVYTVGRPGTGSSYVNRGGFDFNDSISGKRGASSITVMEIAA